MVFIQHSPSVSYTVLSTESFDKTIKKNHRDRKEELQKIKKKLQKYPERYGKPLYGRLHGLWQIRLGDSFRIWYEIDKGNKTVVLKNVHHKDEAQRRY